MDEVNSEGMEQSWIRPSAALRKFASNAPLLTGDEQTEDTSDVRYGFLVGDLGLLVGVNIGAEVTPIPEAVRIPGTPSWFLGVSNLRGSLVSVFDLPRLFGFSSQSTGKESYGLVLDKGERAVGIRIEQYPQALEKLERVGEMPPLPEALMPFVEQAYRYEGSLWVDFDYRRFFSSLTERIAT